jgi:hypothetical protein
MAKPGEQGYDRVEAERPGVSLMTNPIVVRVCVCIALAIAAPFAVAKEPPRNRRAFAEAMSRVKEGMLQAEVLALIGKPDDIRVRWYSGALMKRPDEEWRYGVSQHLAPAMLGEVGFDENARVRFVSGQGAPPPDGLFTERELRHLLEVIHDLGDPDQHYNPRRLICAVNVLQPLGKEKALAAVAEFLRISSENTDTGTWDAIPLMLRTLFEVPTDATSFSVVGEDDPLPPGTLPEIFGAPVPKSADLKLTPRYPMVIEGDIPFLIETAGGSTGPGPMPEAHLAYYRKYGKLRAKPLVPTAKPFAALDTFMKSPRWCFKKSNEVPGNEWDRMIEANRKSEDEHQPDELCDQVLRLLDTVHNFEPDDSGSYFSIGCDPEDQKRAEAKNKKMRADAATLVMRWDPQALHYTFLDGTFVPLSNPTHHPALTWQPTALKRFKIELVIRRQNRWYVELSYLPGVNFSEIRDFPEVKSVRIFDANVKNKPVAEIDHLPLGTRARVVAGHEIEIELTVGNRTEHSPLFKP